MRSPYSWAAETHVGHHRDHNEDRYDAFECPLGHAFIVCDGMGGQAAGDVAATIAIQKVKEFLSTVHPTQPIPYWLRRAIFHAHYAIQNHAQMVYGASGMGTTIVLLLLTPQGEAWWAHTGDSRLYLLREGRLLRLTHDHSYVSLLVDSGFITPEGAFGHPQSNQLLFTLGGSSSITVVDVPAHPLPLRAKDLFLLCSDGVSGLVPDDQIAAILNQKSPLPERVKSIIHAALHAGGYDNATAILVEVKKSGASAPKAGISVWGALAMTVVALLSGFFMGQMIPFQPFSSSAKDSTSASSPSNPKVPNMLKSQLPPPKEAESISVAPKPPHPSSSATGTPPSSGSKNTESHKGEAKGANKAPSSSAPQGTSNANASP
ncbi:MAG: protein phosphatase 2C domain-containing protein [Bacteroidia bacterium]|nr:protein phosphatase 2C domain-containing protein [Bacteroidia bacterium]